MHRLLSLLLCLVIALPATAQESAGAFPEAPELAVSISPQAAADFGGYVNGQIVLRVRVLSRFPFETLDLRLPDIENAQQVRLLPPRTRYLDSYGGSGYVHETAIALFPVLSGVLTIPPIILRGSVEGPDGKVAFADRHPEQHIRVYGIDPAFSDTWWLVSGDVKINEHWSIPPEDIRYGDFVRREVSIVVSGVTADHVPVLEHRPTRGVEVSEDGRTTMTELTPAGAVARVTQAWRLRIGTGGFADIPPLGLAFWHPEERRKRHAIVPGKRLEPLPIDTEATAARLMDEAMSSHRADRTLMWVLVVVLLTPVFAFAGAALWIVVPSLQDLRLIRAIGRGSRSDLDRIRSIESWMRDSRIARDTGDSDGPPIPESYTDLRSSVFGRGIRTCNTRRLSRDLMRLSRRLRLRRVAGLLSRI